MVNTVEISRLNENFERVLTRLDTLADKTLTPNDVTIIARKEIDAFYRKRLNVQAIVFPFVIGIATLISNYFLGTAAPP